MRKPLVLGCLVIFVLLLAGGGVAAWVYGRPYVETVLAVRDLGRIQDLESRVRNTSRFEAPATGILEADQVQRYLSAADTVLQRLEGQLDLLRVRYEQLEDADGLSASQLAGAWSDIIRLVVKAKEAQVEALNATGFSLAEYGWVREQVIRAAGLPAYQVNLAALGSDSAEPAVWVNDAPVPDENTELVRPHVQQLEKLLPLAAFGL